MNHGSKNYHWQVVRPHAKQAVGDQRINPFGVGGEIEIRSGLLVQKQPINGPQLHFGLGNQTSAEVVRVVWPNGTVRAEFGVKADQEVVTEQRLKASCPFLFAYNGNEDGIRQGCGSVGLGDWAAHQHARLGEDRGHRRVVQDRPRPTRAARWILRPAHHGGTLGGLLLRSYLR